MNDNYRDEIELAISDTQLQIEHAFRYGPLSLEELRVWVCDIDRPGFVPNRLAIKYFDRALGSGLASGRIVTDGTLYSYRPLGIA